MMTVNALISALVLAGFAVTAHAQDAARAKPDTATKAKNDDEKVESSDKRTRMVCTNERVTGSRFTKRVCLTEEESERLREAGKEAVERVQRMPIPVVSE